MHEIEIDSNLNNIITIVLFVIMFLCLVIFAPTFWPFSFIVLFNMKD